MLSIVLLHLHFVLLINLILCRVNCSVSSLAWFMSNQEMSFVTIGQRVLARPLKYVLFLILNYLCKPRQLLDIIAVLFFQIHY